MGAETLLLNMDDVRDKRSLMSRIGSLTGLWEFKLKERKRTRTLDQNRYYWVAVVTPWLEWLRAEYGDPDIDKEQAHELLKGAVLGRQALKNAKGEEVEVSRRTRDMKTDEFARYVEAAALFLAAFAGIVVVPAEMFVER